MPDELGRADHEWRVSQEAFVALSVAASLAFYEAQGRSTRAIDSREAHDDALNMAASALSRLLTIFSMDETTRMRVGVKLDVAAGKFIRGATEFRRGDGSIVGAMSVKRADLTSALSLIRRVGIPFGLAIADEPAAAMARPPAKKTPETK